MSSIHQLLSAPIKFPIHSATEEERSLFSDKSGAVMPGYFYHIELTSGQIFVGYLDTAERQAFFRPSNNLSELSHLKEIHYFTKYFYSKPELISELVLTENCPVDEKENYHTLFDSRSQNMFDSERSSFKNHSLGQFAAKVFAPLRELDYAKKMAFVAQKNLRTILNGTIPVQQQIQERR